MGPSASAGKKFSAPTITTTPISQAMNRGVWVRRVPGAEGTVFFMAREPAIARTGMRSSSGRRTSSPQWPCCKREYWRSARQKRCRCYCPPRKRHKNLAETVGPGVKHGGLPAGIAPRRPYPDRTSRWDQDDQGGHLHFIGFDFLPQIFRRSPDHKPGHKDRDNHKDQHSIKPEPTAPIDHFTQLHQPHRHHSAEGGKGIVHGVHRTVGGGGRGRRP